MAVEQNALTPISVLICTRNRPDDIVYVMPSVMAQDYPDYEVILIDQSTDDETQERILGQFGSDPRLRYIRTKTKGLSIARNIALREARHEICAFTDDDCLVPPCWLVNIANAYAKHPETEVLFGPVHIPDDMIHRTDLHFPCFYFEEERTLRPGEVFGMGANMSLRKSFWQKNGPFDPMLGAGAPLAGAEEHDWLYRAHRNKATIRLAPQNSIQHRAWRTPEQWNKIARQYAYADAAFAMKHLRCGDWTMIPKMLHGVFYIGARGLLRIVQRNPGFRYEMNYSWGYWNGVWGSLRYGLDKGTRLFHPIKGYSVYGDDAGNPPAPTSRNAMPASGGAGTPTG